MRKPVALITGAAGEIGHTLIRDIAVSGEASVVTLDVKPLDAELQPYVLRSIVGSILDRNQLDQILAEFEISIVYHLAALLSTRAELVPMTAHQVNVEGTLNLLEFAEAQARSHGGKVIFFYPSSIAVYGLPNLAEKSRAGRVPEESYNLPITMYGCNKLYCEHLGRYYARHYKQLDAEPQAGRVDFRALRFPGLISAFTVPAGGTSDYAPEMIHAAARGESYRCFVREDARIPFMAMPDAVRAIFDLVRAPREQLSRVVYNVAAFDPTAEAVAELVREAFPDASIAYAPDAKRQGIVDSWPAAVEDGAARRDWGFAPRLDLRSAFAEYLIPNIRAHYDARR